MIDQRLRLEYLPLSKLKEFATNPKAHLVAEIGQSAKRYGFNDPPAINERTGTLIEGHGRRAALLELKAAGAEPPAHVVVDGDEWLVPVLRGVSFASDDEAEEYLIAHNEIGRAGGYNNERLAPMLERMKARRVNLEGLGLRRKEVQKLLHKSREQRIGGRAELAHEEAVKASKRWKVEPGQLWEIQSKTVTGRAHRLLVGDSMHPETIARVLGSDQLHTVISDPPYAIYGSSTGIGADITDDAMVRPFFEAVFRICSEHLPWFGSAHVCCDWRSWAAIWESAKRGGMTARNLIVWDKGGGGMGNNYAMCYELAGYFVKIPPMGSMHGTKQTGMRQVLRPNLQRFLRPAGAERLHNAAKPIGLMVEFVQNSSDPGALVLDPFCGSGTTLIACEQAERVCYTIDNTPKHAAVALERLARLDLTPKLIK